MEMHKVFYQGIKLKLFEPKQAICMAFFVRERGNNPSFERLSMIEKALFRGKKWKILFFIYKDHIDNFYRKGIEIIIYYIVNSLDPSGIGLM
jgi:hypothetical protein